MPLHASNEAKGSGVVFNASSGRGFFSFRSVDVVDAVPNASCTFAVKGSKLSSTNGSAPSISKGSPYLWFASLNGSSLNSRPEYL